MNWDAHWEETKEHFSMVDIIERPERVKFAVGEIDRAWSEAFDLRYERTALEDGSGLTSRRR